MATTILAILVTPLVEISKCLLAPLGRKIDYFVHYHKNIFELKKDIIKLGETKNTIIMNKEEALHKGETIDVPVEKWLRKVEEMEAEVKKFVGVSEENNRCFLDLHFCPRYKLSKKAVETQREIFGLQRDGEKFNSISHMGPPPSIGELPIGDFVAFTSTKSTMKSIMEALYKSDVSIIGVHGMAGVGKTTLVKAVGGQVKVNQTFDDVIMVTVSQNHILKKIQREIAEGLGLLLHEETVEIRARRISARLKQEKNILIILDDVWERLELGQIGIPYGVDHMGCKVVLTTRRLDVCYQMDSTCQVEVVVLSEDDSWDFFQKFAGNIVNFPKLHNVAKTICRECGGLPLALVTLGRALRNKKASTWFEAANELRASKPINIEGMHEKVYQCIKLSFDYLRSEEAIYILFYCCLFPEDYFISIESLVLYGIGDGFLGDIQTIQEGRTRVNAIIENLIASCLLMNDGRDGYVKMHDVIRDVTKHIASDPKHGFMAMPRMELKSWPRSGFPKHIKRISLMSNSISKLPDQINYPGLLILLLQYNHGFLELSDKFFIAQEALKVLDLSSDIDDVETDDDDIESDKRTFALPSSLSCLKNLRMLSLDRRRLNDISILGELTALEILSLMASYLQELPQEIRKLSNLRYLNLFGYRGIKIPPNVISSMTVLEELYISLAIGESNTSELATIEDARASDLTYFLGLYIRSLDFLFKDISKLEYLRVVEINAFGYSRCMKIAIRDYTLATQSFCHVESIELWKKPQYSEQLTGPELFKCLRSLGVHKFVGKIIFPFELSANLGCLENLLVSRCPELEGVFRFKDLNLKCNGVPRLTTITLEDLPELKSIWTCTGPTISFPNLESIYIYGCPKLMKLFTPSMTKALPNLACLYISHCKNLVVIISSDVEEDAMTSSPKCELIKILFPKLKMLILQKLSELTSLVQPETLWASPLWKS